MHYFLAAAFLVSVPVFAQAPLVRSAPWVSLVMTLAWLALAAHLMSERSSRYWGDLLYGFALTWLAGSLYWGWLRVEPLWHLPIESIGIPFAIWGLRRGSNRVGNFFYLGSLLGTAVTDLYIHSVALLPEWRQVMQADPVELASGAFESALVKMQTPWGCLWALELCMLLLVVGLWSLRRGWTERNPSQSLGWLVFSGAVLSTLVVDSLFWWSAVLLTR